jgi:hypothetical protein
MASATALDSKGITHLVILNEDNQPVQARCNKVSRRALGTEITHYRPSCAPCARLWDQERS